LLIFVQACESLLEVVDGLATGSRTASTKAFVARSMTLGRAQHRDLQGVRPDGLERAARQAEEKTEAIPLAAELAALAMGCDMARVQTYAEIARSIGLLNQAANDLVDLYGKRESDDLRAGKWTLPLVAHFEQSDAAQREELVRLREALPGSLPRIRELLLAGGALTRVAQLIERVRRGVHERIRALGRTQAPIAMLGAHADAIASRLYKLSEVDR
ncbi:MAG TPA: polyprenyl synthetase family protein, partial [Nannocystaceae bacterium]|nr:polyprenyl synthetase family protein [Nannocystaceae bacterium]